MPGTARCSLRGIRTISGTDTSTTSTASTTKSAIRRRSQNWMAVLQRATEKPVGSIFIFIFNFAAVDFAVANELELTATLHHLRSGGDFGFLQRIPEIRRTNTNAYTTQKKKKTHTKNTHKKKHTHTHTKHTTHTHKHTKHSKHTTTQTHKNTRNTHKTHTVSTQPSAQTFVSAQLPIQTSSQHCHDTSHARWSRP